MKLKQSATTSGFWGNVTGLHIYSSSLTFFLTVQILFRNICVHVADCIVINLLLLKKYYSKPIVYGSHFFFRSLVGTFFSYLSPYYFFFIMRNEGKIMESNKVWELSKTSERRAVE